MTGQAGSTLRTVLEGLLFGESVRWHGDRVWVCDWGTGEVICIDGDGQRETVVEVPSFPVCIDWLPDGRLLAVSGGDRRVLRVEADGSVSTHAELGAIPSERWNEIAVDPEGWAFVNGMDGVIAAVGPDGSVRQVAAELAFPNGMILSEDGSTLVVAESHGRRLTAFDVRAGGALENRRTWADLGEDAPDGICFGADGTIWYADVPHRCCRQVREGGEILPTIELDRGCFSCAITDGDRPELYIAATEWRGFEQAFAEPRTGMLVSATLPTT